MRAGSWEFPYPVLDLGIRCNKCNKCIEWCVGSARLARRALRLGRIVAITTPGNTASQAVLKKIGLKAAGVVRLPGKDEDSAYFVSEG
ncbi:GNAT family protein [Phenylobacterium sp.]|uniref:GNAT family N-acetyltransferase n=1 Tax=Phenylobacterium sp. TaxID=1871053 RepID=UPI0034506DA6